MRYYSEETVKKIMTNVEVDSFPSNLYDTSLRTVERIYPDLNKFDSIEIPESPWHTGTPTEEGWYTIAFIGANKRIEYASAVWCYNEWDAHCRILAWQKIEPYKEKTE